MQTKIRIINGEKYVPVYGAKKEIFRKSGIPLYRIGNLKTEFIKVNNK